MTAKPIGLVAVLVALMAVAAAAAEDPPSELEYLGEWPGSDSRQVVEPDFPPLTPNHYANSCPPVVCDEPGFYAGVEFLYLQVHFSEAVAFSRVTDSLAGGMFNRRAEAVELDFDYETSPRLTLGYHLDPCSQFQLTYWYFDDDVAVGETVSQPNQTIVDPFGNTAAFGERVATQAAVKMNVYDLDVVKRAQLECGSFALRYLAGLRFADIEQYYESAVFTAGGVQRAFGDFEVAFHGVGPHLGFETQSSLVRGSGLFFTARGSGALLVGDYDVSSGLIIPGVASGRQAASRTRAVPVFETELGVTWQPTSRLSLSAGWQFQAWFNVGTSGGQFDGELLVPPVDSAFVGTDDADIMSFDGLVLRSQLEF